MKPNDRTAWVHPNPMLSDRVVLPDGYQMDRTEADAKGYTVTSWPKSEMAAVIHPHEEGQVVLARGAVVSRDTAREAGFTIGERHMRSPDTKGAWRGAICALPEAQSRPAATAEILTSRTPDTPVDQIRAFLRGLPEEISHTEIEEIDMTTATDDPKAARLAEIERSMNAFNKNNGHAGKDLRASIADIDPARLRRLAEIKLNAMNSNGRSMTSEFRSLKLALDVHSRMGGDFSRVLTENGVSVESLRPKAI